MPNGKVEQDRKQQQSAPDGNGAAVASKTAGVRSALAGMSYEEQVAALAPKSPYVLGSTDSVIGKGKQVKYGPTEGLDEKDQAALLAHYGTEGTVKTKGKGRGKGKGGKAPKEDTPLERLSQYDDRHATYVAAAEQTGRGLTRQEVEAKKSGKNAGNASINHILASGTGQNVLNRMTLQFDEGAKEAGDESLRKTATAKEGDVPEEAQESARKWVRAGLAKQAAAVGRFAGYSRGIISEREGEKGMDVAQERNEVLGQTLNAFQGKEEASRYASYKDVLKRTFDSPGNIRVGDDKANIKISTGLDVPLDKDGNPTEHGKRLLDVHEAYAPDDLLADGKRFTPDEQGRRLSSSQEVG